MPPRAPQAHHRHRAHRRAPADRPGEAARLPKRHGQVTVVEGLRFTVPNGAITGFLDPNGAGKSTTTRCPLGRHRRTTGTVLIVGLPLTAQTRPAEVVGAVLDASWF